MTEASFTMHLADVEGVIEREITAGAKQRDVAKAYALALRSDWPTDWGRVNSAIRQRWPKGLERVKKLAWTAEKWWKTA